MSEQTEPQIYAAIAKAQSNMTKARKDKTNPHFRSKYADLEAVLDACLPALNAEGIALIQAVSPDGNAVITRLVMGSESLDCSVPLLGDHKQMQTLGSALTYARRYGAMLICGLATEDDDANAAAEAPPKKAKPDFKKLYARIQNCNTDDELIKAEEWIHANAVTSKEALLKGVEARRDEIAEADSHKSWEE